MTAKDSSTARRPKRDVDGILLLDKPTGITSNRALQIAKRLYTARKAGHTGSLDPLATGMLPLCFGQATKVSGFLLDADKEYEVTLTIGSRTDTADADAISEFPVHVNYEWPILGYLRNFDLSTFSTGLWKAKISWKWKNREYYEEINLVF